VSAQARRYYERGKQSLDSGDLESAQQALSSALQLAPTFGNAIVAYAVALARAGDCPRAAAILRSGVPRASSKISAAAMYATLGDVLTLSGDLFGAEDAFNLDAGEQRRALLPGDLDVEAERRLLERAVDLRADVLLLPHHGSRSSSSAAFLDAVAPRLAIASAPCRGRFGMPHREVRERLAARGTPLCWTGRDGALRVPLRGPLQLRGTGPPARCP
jgi:hypothetical protein